MKIYIMTDMEGVCGVANHDDWVVPGGRYYETGKKLLTLEVNAAVESFFAGGASEVFVADGHGYGGINQLLLAKRTRYIRGAADASFGLDASFSAIAFIGQHAKAGTEYAHIAHTGWFDVLDYTINDLSLGEFGLFTLTAGQLGVPCIFASGDLALTKEAAGLLAGLETVSVKEGINPGSGAACDTDAYRKRNLAAIHYHPDYARQLIKAGAARALARFRTDQTSCPLLQLKPPYRAEIKYRPEADKPARTVVKEHPSDLLSLLSQ